jgi:hypothetical protein
MRRSHLIAPLLVLAMLCTLIAPRRLRQAARLAVLSYLLAVAGTAAGAEDRSDGLRLLGVLPAMHLGWGAGTLVGMGRFGLPVAAFANLLRAVPAPVAAQASDGVHAPSLHGEGG